MLGAIERTIAGRRRIHLLRHGEVSYFDGAGRPRQHDAVALSEDGRRQAQAAAHVLERVPLDRVVASGLPRAAETAAYVLAGRDLELEVLSDLREIAPGRFAGHSPEERERAFARAFRQPVDCETRFLGGETFGSLAERVLKAFAAILDDPGWREIAIVAHGGTNRVILSHALGAELKAAGAIEQDPGCLNMLDIDPDGSFLVRMVNFTPCAPAKEELRATAMERIYLEYIAGARASGDAGSSAAAPTA